MQRPRRVEGHGSGSAQLVVVGEAPGRVEDESGIPLSGPTGKLTDRVLENAGTHRGEVYVTNVVKYRPPNNDFKRLDEIGVDLGESIRELWDEIHTINPNCILALGNESLRALTGKDKIVRWRGSILLGLDGKTKVVPTIHPANFLDRTDREVQTFKFSALAYVTLDFRRAVEESVSPLYAPPSRTLEIAWNSLDLYRFFRQYEDRDRYPYCAIDIEAHHCIPICISFAFTRFHAISVPLLHEIPGWGPIEKLNKYEVVQMWQMVAEKLADPKLKKIGQNFKYDQQKIARPLGMRVNNIWIDTGLLAHALYPEHPRSLEFLTSIWTREPYYKDEYREFNPKRDRIDRIYIYNARDSAVTVECAEEMLKEADDLGIRDFFFDIQMQGHGIYLDIEKVGLLLNQEKNKELKKKYTTKIEERQARLDELCHREVNVNSNPQMRGLLYEYLELPKRWQTDRRTGRQTLKTDEDTIVALLANNVKRSPVEGAAEILELVLEIRGLRKTKSTYLNARPDYDGRMRTSYNIVGTETGRSSTKIMKPPVRPDKMGIAFQTMTKHSPTGSDLLTQFDSDPGYVFIEVDMSQAEARIVALLSEDYELLERWDQPGFDIHKLTASWIMGMKPHMITKELRFLGKKVRHAGNYDMKKHRLMIETNNDARKYGIDFHISEWRAGQVLDTFHQYSSKIKDVFHQQIVRALQENERVLINPFGRRREFFERWGEDLFKEAYAQIPQSTVPDALRRGIIRIRKEDPDVRIAVEWHDSILGIVPEKEADAYISLFKRCIEVPIDFSQCTLPRGTLLIPTEAKIGTNYGHLEKYPKAA